MRIAVVCSDLGVRIPGTKGASIHLLAITKAFAEMGHQVLLVGVAGHGEAPLGVQALLLPHPGRAEGLRREVRKLLFTRRIVGAAAPEILRFQPDVVYERLSLFGTAGCQLARNSGALHVLEINALLTEEESAWRSLTLRRLARRREDCALRSAAIRVAVSDELAGRVEARCGRHVDVVPNGVERDLFETMPDRIEARRSLGLPIELPLVGFSGSLRPWHGLDVAIDALADLPGVGLVVAGDGDIRAELEARAASQGVADRIYWLGQLPHDRIPTFLSAIDIAVAPYPPLEGFIFSPLKLYEYLAAGTPVVASAIGQIPAVVGGFGDLVAPGDASALANAIARILARPEDARITAAAGREWVLANHGWDERARTLTDLFSAEVDHALAK